MKQLSSYVLGYKTTLPSKFEIDDDVVFFDGKTWKLLRAKKDVLHKSFPGIGRKANSYDLINALRFIDFLPSWNQKTIDVGTHNNIIRDKSLKYTYQLPTETVYAGLVLESAVEDGIFLLYKNFIRI